MAEVVNMPRLGLNEDQSMIGEWFVKEGDPVKEGTELFSIETDKSSMAVNSETAGVVLKRFYDEYDVVDVMTPVCVIGQPGEDIGDIKPASAAGEAAAEEETDAPQKAEPFAVTDDSEREAAGVVFKTGDEVFISPRAKKLAKANGVDISGIVPSGAENRIIECDIIAKMKTRPIKVAKENLVSEAKVKPFCGEEGTRIVKMSNIRKVIANNMMFSLRNIAQLTSHAKFNASMIQKYRERYKASLGDEKNITITDMVLFATVKALHDYDYMNVHTKNEDELIFFGYVNLGCAVDTAKGLMVPTLKNAQNMSLVELSKALKQLAEKCRDGRMTPDEMADATFTVSNLGRFGVVDFTPIINPPQVGILGVGTIDYAVKKTDEGVLYYPAGHLSLTFNHCAVDGAPAAKFLQAVCNHLENFDKLV